MGTTINNESFDFQSFIDYLKKCDYADKANCLHICFEQKCHIDERVLNIIGKPMQRSRLSEKQQLIMFQKLSQYVYEETEELKQGFEVKEEQATKKIEDLQTELEDKKQKLHKVHNIVCNLKNQLEEKEKQSKELSEQINQLEDELEEKNKLINSLERKCEELQSKNQQLSNEHREVLDTCETNHKKQMEKIDSKHEQQMQDTQKNHEIEVRLIKEKHEEQMAVLKEYIDNLPKFAHLENTDNQQAGTSNRGK